MKKALASLLLPLALAACASTDPAPEASLTLQSIEVRAVVRPNARSATEYMLDGEKLLLGKPATFQVSRAYATQDGAGMRAVGFEITEDDREAFTERTRELVHDRMAVLVDGEVVCAPIVRTPLPGAGIIAGGASGFDEAQVEALVEALQPR